jgi:hypothetical protein
MASFKRLKMLGDIIYLDNHLKSATISDRKAISSQLLFSLSVLQFIFNLFI